MGQPVRFGILGAAAIAPSALVKPAAGHARAVVAAVAAREPARAQAFADRWEIDRVHPSYESLVADPAIDAVYVPLPNGLHGRWSLAALEAGKHVLCEKPFAANATEAAEVAAAAAARPDQVVMEAFHWRYHPQHRRVVELLREGAIGEIRGARAAFCVPNPRRRDIRWRADLAGGALMDLGCYPLNMVRAVVGDVVGAEPTVLAARIGTRSADVDSVAEVELDVGGVPVGVVCSMWSRRVLDVSLRVWGSEGELRVRNPVAPQVGGRIVVRSRSGRLAERAARSTSYSHQLDAFCAAVIDGAPFPSTAADAVANMAVIDAVYRAGGLEPRRPTA